MPCKPTPSASPCIRPAGLFARRGLFVFATIAASVTPITKAGELLIYLVGGQSNGDGRAEAAQLSDKLRKPRTDIPFYYRSEGYNTGLYGPLRPGSAGVPTPKDSAFGPEITFGRDLVDWINQHHPDDRVAIIKYAKGGSSLHTDWKPDGTAASDNDGPYYQRFQETVSAGLLALKADPSLSGLTPRLAGMLWIQGESDTDGKYDYAANLNLLITDVRQTYGNIPVFISGLSLNQTVFTKGSAGARNAFEQVRAAQKAVVKHSQACAFIDTDSADFTVRPDGVHFDFAGQQALGHAFSAAAITTLE